MIETPRLEHLFLLLKSVFHSPAFFYDSLPVLQVQHEIYRI